MYSSLYCSTDNTRRTTREKSLILAKGGERTTIPTIVVAKVDVGREPAMAHGSSLSMALNEHFWTTKT